MSYEFSNVYDMIESTYGAGSSSVMQVQKSDAPVISTTTGVFNAVFGAMAFNQTNMEGNAWAVLPKYPWVRSGYRAITADAGSTGDGGYTEAAAIPDTIKPTFAEITVTAKEVVHTFQVSYLQQRLAQTEDDAFGNMAQMREYFAAKHAKALNEQILRDATTLAATSKSFESLDRVTAATALVTGGQIDAGDEDIYGIDRSGASWADAQVSENSGTDRTLTLDIITDLIATLKTAGARTNVILTGNDTLMRITNLANSSVRYNGIMSEAKVQVGVNGVETEEGIAFGVRVATLFGIPVFTSQGVQQDTISRIYLLDTTPAEGTGLPRLGIALLQPTMYLEAGIGTAGNDVFGVNSMSTKGLFYTSGELVCTFLAAQGSIRDLK